MSSSYESLGNEINECFFEIVGIINEIIDYRTNSFSNMLDLNEEIQEGSRKFVDQTGGVVNAISEEINEKIENLNMEKMKQEILDATETFIAITEELELLSYNTICRTMALGEKGATITHISKEIKKYSTTVKTLLDVISGNFNEVFNNFKEVADHLLNKQLVDADSSFDVDALEDFAMTSDASVLIENSQFHDIFTQELDIINSAISNTSYANAYEAGLLFGVFEKAQGKLDFIKYSLQDKLEGIKSVMGDFIYSFNTDLQNIVGNTNILRSELSRVSKLSVDVCSNVDTLYGNIASTKNLMRKTKISVDDLAKQSKTFRNLVVITAVEVARINDDSLRSVVVSMNETEHELNQLIDKLYVNIDMWESLREDFIGTFSKAKNEMSYLCKGADDSDRKRIMDRTDQLDQELSSFREVFMADKYVNFFDSTTERLVNLFSEYNESVQETFMDLNNTLGDEILSAEEFTNGRNDAELKDILAEDNEQSSVEFF